VRVMKSERRTYRSILVTREVYEKLRSLRKSGESFSDVINDLMHKKASNLGLRRLEGILADDKEALSVFEEGVEAASKHFRWVR